MAVYNSRGELVQEASNRQINDWRSTQVDRYSGNNSYNRYNFSSKNRDTYYHNNGFRKNYY